MKEKKYLLLIAGIVVIIIVFLFALQAKKAPSNYENNVQNNTEEVIETESVEERASSSPLAKGEFVIEMMNEAEKEALGIDKNQEAQVLMRDKNGSIILNRIIMSDADYVKTQADLDALITPVPPVAEEATE